MMMPWDKIDWTAVGTGILFIVLITFQSVRGFVLGRSGSEKPAGPRSGGSPESVEVAGALIDTKRIDLLIAELGALVGVVTALRKALEEHAARVDSNSRAAQAVAEHADKLAREMRDLRDETKDLRDEMLRGARGR